jgi:hypothetical protein
LVEAENYGGHALPVQSATRHCIAKTPGPLTLATQVSDALLLRYSRLGNLLPPAQALEKSGAAAIFRVLPAFADLHARQLPRVQIKTMGWNDSLAQSGNS